MQKRKAATMEDYLQMDDWEPPKINADGKKRVKSFGFKTSIK